MWNNFWPSIHTHRGNKTQDLLLDNFKLNTSSSWSCIRQTALSKNGGWTWDAASVLFVEEMTLKRNTTFHEMEKKGGSNNKLQK